MILASWNAIPKNIEQVDFLKGPAKVYDGAFDEDKLSSIPLTTESSFSLLITADFNRTDTYFFNTRQNTSANKGIYIGQNLSGKFGVVIVAPTGNQYVIAYDGVKVGKKTIIITYDGSRSMTGVEVYSLSDNLQLTRRDTPQFGSFQIGDDPQIGGNLGNPAFDGAIKQFEIINRVATPAEIADASDPVTGGSFRASGIAHNSGDYLLAVDFNQTDGNPPTTFANTPTYTITSFGGAQYVPYESL